MDNKVIESLLIELIDAHLKEKGELCFSDLGKDIVSWDNKWIAMGTSVDPLALVLLHKNPERIKTGDDNILTATLSEELGKSPWFIRSFYDGWFGRKNKSMSISAFLIGERLRKKYKPKEE